MYGVAVYVKEGFPFEQDLSLEKTLRIFMFGLALRHSISYFFFLHRSPSSFCTAFDVVLSNRGEVRSVIPSAYVYVFRDFNVHHKDFLTYSGGTDRPGELCHNFCHLTMVNFPTRILDCDSTALPFWIYFFS